MKRKVKWHENERVDIPDAEAIHDLADESQRALLAALVHAASENAAVVVYGLTLAVVEGNNTQITVAPGAAICTEELADGTTQHGQLMESPPQAWLLDFSGLPHATYNVWVRFQYLTGETQNRAQWHPELAPERERVELLETRFIADWSVTADEDTPIVGEGWFKVGEVDWDGSITPANLRDTRTLLFEGVSDADAAPPSGWTIPDFSRSADRATHGVFTLFRWVMAVNKRFEEAFGRQWTDSLRWNENVRSGASTILVATDATQEKSAHYLIAGTPAQNRTALASLVLIGNWSYASNVVDARTVFRFIPRGNSRALVELDMGTGAIDAADPRVPQVLEGPVTLRRTAGANPILLLRRVDWAFRGVRFEATGASASLIQVTPPGGETRWVVFEDCEFASTTALASAVSVSAGARVEFRRCRFEGTLFDTFVSVAAGGEAVFDDCTFTQAHGVGESANTALTVAGRATCRSCSWDAGSATGGSPAVQASGAAHLLIQGGRMSGGPVGIYSTVNATGSCVAVGTEFTAIGKALAGTAGLADTLLGCRIDATTKAVDTPALQVPADDAAATSGALLTSLTAQASYVEALLARVHFGVGRHSAIYHAGQYAQPELDGAPVDMRARYLMALSHRMCFGDNATGARWQKIDNRVALLDYASTDDADVLYAHVWRMLLGKQPTNALALFNRNVLPKAWGTIRWDSEGNWSHRVIRGNGLNNISVSPVDLAGNNVAQPVVQAHRWRLSGLGLPDAFYDVHVTVSTVGTMEFYGAAEGYATKRFECQVSAKTTGGFLLSPIVLDINGAGDDVAKISALTPAEAVEGYQITWFIGSICDLATFVAGGEG